MRAATLITRVEESNLSSGVFSIFFYSKNLVYLPRRDQLPNISRFPRETDQYRFQIFVVLFATFHLWN